MFIDRKKVDFVSKARIFGSISIALVIVSVAIFASRGLNYGIDFAGGTEIQVQFKNQVDPQQIRDVLKEVQFGDAMVQHFGERGQSEFLIRVQNTDTKPNRFEDEIRQRLNELLQSKNLKHDKDNAVEVRRLRFNGDRLYATLSHTLPAEEIHQALNGVGGGELKVRNAQIFGKEDDHEYLINFSGVAAIVTGALDRGFGDDSYTIRREDTVGPKVGRELRQNGVAAVMVALVFILLYIWIRFNMTFAPGAVAALVHDVLITVGVFSFLQREVNLSIIAALLTIVGYSLNDTIVIYDRIRENLKKFKGKPLGDVVNISLNQTLSRTVLTSMTTLLVTLSLLFFGGAIIYNFALALTLGVIVGTYSSIFVASPLMIYFTERYDGKRKEAA